MARAFIDLHCHTRASFDCLSDPAKVVRLAAQRGLTHIAITDHDRIDGALEARAAAPDGLTVIVGEEVKTADGDLICVFLERAIPPGLSAVETIAAARAQGGLVGIPHPFDSFRGSMSKSGALAELAPLVDWIEGHNARLVGKGNEQAIDFALAHGRPIVAVSDAHSHDRGGRRLHGAGRRSVDARGAAGRPRRRPRARARAGRPTSSGC